MATTGTQSSGTMTGLNDALKNVYGKPFENNVEKEQELTDLVVNAEGFDVTDGPDGKSIQIQHTFSSGGGVGAMNEDDYLYTPTQPTIKQSSIVIPQLTATVELSGRVLRRVKQGPAAFATWAQEALPRKAQRLAFHKDRMYLGTGTGIVAKYGAGTIDGAADVIQDAYGITGLEGAVNLLLRDDTFRAGPNPNGSALRVGVAQVAAVHYGATLGSGTIDTTVAGSAAAPTAAAAGDYLFLGDANVNGAGKEITGLEAIIDDGSNVGTFQGLSRTTYPELSGQVIDSTANGFTGTLTESLVDFADSQAYERAMGRTNAIVLNRSGQRNFWNEIRKDRRINDPRGTYVGGKSRLTMILGSGEEVVLMACRKVPLSRAYGIDRSAIQRYKIGSGRWDDTDGSVWNRVVDGTGRKDAFFAVYVEEEQLGAGAPARCWKLTKLTAA